MYTALFPQIVIFCFVPLEADGFVKSEESEESFPRVLELLQTLGSSFQSWIQVDVCTTNWELDLISNGKILVFEWRILKSEQSIITFLYGGIFLNA